MRKRGHDSKNHFNWWDTCLYEWCVCMSFYNEKRSCGKKQYEAQEDELDFKAKSELCS